MFIASETVVGRRDNERVLGVITGFQPGFPHAHRWSYGHKTKRTPPSKASRTLARWGNVGLQSGVFENRHTLATASVALYECNHQIATCSHCPWR